MSFLKNKSRFFDDQAEESDGNEESEPDDFEYTGERQRFSQKPKPRTRPQRSDDDEEEEDEDEDGMLTYVFV